ncbi:MAG: hypothetical protein HC895_22930 [Leptolyngbyaceae cyanobacterium SM1_3_5]|nr:hypothetical protein [Leptolyngbyaceae cyanobacterium SM1_3_5]
MSRIAENLIAANQYRAALQVAEVIPEPSERFAKLDQAIAQALNANDFAIVLPVLDRLSEPRFKTRWLIAIIDRHAQQGQPQRAIDLLNRAFQSARTVPGDESQTIAVRGGENPLIVDDDQDRGSFYEAIALRFAASITTGRALELARSLQNTQASPAANAANRLLSVTVQPRRSIRCSPTRSAFAITVKAGLMLALEGKKLLSTT